jgi:hypothetical protein
MKYFDLIIGAVLLIFGALAFSRATRATDPAVRRREWVGTTLCTVAGLIFVCLYIFSPSAAPKERAATEARP